MTNAVERTVCAVARLITAAALHEAGRGFPFAITYITHLSSHRADVALLLPVIEKLIS